jgi:hypothetical protein
MREKVYGRQPIYINDQFLDKEYVKQLRQQVVELRDGALQAGRFDYAVSLSLVHAILMNYEEELAA